jgi:DNA polymerase III epsilon subunit-like protein
METSTVRHEPREYLPKNLDKPYVMIFDVETTGLIPKTEKSHRMYGKKVPTKDELDEAFFKASNSPSENKENGELPHIIQLSYVMYHLPTNNVIKIFNEYIKLPNDMQLTAEITALTGITQEMCDTQGIPIVAALTEFAQDYELCQTIVSHNLHFDRAIMMIEMSRKWMYGFAKTVFNDQYHKENYIDLFCTMQHGRDICNIWTDRKPTAANPKTWKYKKMPKLIELYETLFRKTPENLHNSLVDTLVCMRCFLKMRHGVDIDDANFNEMLAYRRL